MLHFLLALMAAVWPLGLGQAPNYVVTFDAGGYCAETNQATADEAHLPVVWCAPGMPVSGNEIAATEVHGYCEEVFVYELLANGWEGAYCDPPHMVILP